MYKAWINDLKLEEKAYEILSRPNSDGSCNQEPFLSSASNIVSEYSKWIIDNIDKNSHLGNRELNVFTISLINR